MKKKSGFEKFINQEKKGAAKKEELRQQKRKYKKEREEAIAQRKRQVRAERDEFRTPARGPKKAKTSFRQEEERPARRVTKASSDTPRSRTSAGTSRTKAASEGSRSRTSTGVSRSKPAAEGSRPKNLELKPRTAAPKANKAEAPAKTRTAPTKKLELKPKAAGTKAPAKAPGKTIKAPGKTAKTGKTAKPVTTAAEAGLMPLNKYLAHSGVSSRREAADIIKSGKVKVNGEVVTEPGHKVTPSDDVKVANKKVVPVADLVYILLNKPKDYLTTTDDPQQRKTVLDLIKQATTERVYPVGRLDRNTSGVLLLTNDGELAQQLTHPSHEIKKVYAVTLDKPLERKHFDEILKGVNLEDGMAYVDVLGYTDAGDKTKIGVELHTGRNRIVRRLFEHFGYDVKALDRVMFAGLTKKNVERGKWRLLTDREVRDLKYFKKGKK
ncbi:pseudouridine synthase [Paraflavisolibacter sp. H34]|uniref:pseudouridine synthase n=1 Tax=Huijunlia imazamoxiresistens TaxID=3127457 RepID=UPI00301A459B